MSPRSLFNIILKIFGLFLIKDMLVAIPEVLATATLMFSYGNEGLSFFSTFLVLLTISIYILITYCLVFRTGWVIDYLKLENGFSQEKLQFNLHRSVVLAIAVIVIGGLLVIAGIPQLVGQIANYVQDRGLNSGALYTALPNYTFLIIYSCQVLIGLLMIGYQRQIVLLIESRRKV